MKHYNIIRVFAGMLLVSAAPALSAATTDGHLLKVTDINIDRVGADGSRLAVAVTIDPRSVDPGRDREVVFTPLIISSAGTDTVALDPIRVAGRNRYFSHIRNKDLADGVKLYRAGTKELIDYRREVEFRPWMMHCRVEMEEQIGHCCDPILPAGDTPLAEIDYSQPAYNASTFPYVDLTGDAAIERVAEGSAYIDFIVNRTEIRPTYRRNTVELAKIIESIDFVKNDPDAVITRVTIKGFASPEGSYSNNVRLAMGRTQALKEYVREHYNFDPAIMSTDYEPEDWEGLRRRMLAIEMPHKEEILQIVDSPMEPDPKNAEIQRRYPTEYKFLLDSIYPALRHSDYTVKYRIKTFVDIDELKRIYNEDPSKLRPVDFQRIAATYPVGSPEYDRVYLKASEIYPLDSEAAINAANIYMKHGDLAKAADRLLYAGDRPEAIYSRATLAALNGDLERARQLFDRSAADGYEPAAAESRRVDEMIRRTKVTYLIKPTSAH